MLSELRTRLKSILKVELAALSSNEKLLHELVESMTLVGVNETRAGILSITLQLYIDITTKDADGTVPIIVTLNLETTK